MVKKWKFGQGKNIYLKQRKLAVDIKKSFDDVIHVISPSP